jgi:hypothetical protein
VCSFRWANRDSERGGEKIRQQAEGNTRVSCDLLLGTEKFKPNNVLVGRQGVGAEIPQDEETSKLHDKSETATLLVFAILTIVQKFPRERRLRDAPRRWGKDSLEMFI